LLSRGVSSWIQHTNNVLHFRGVLRGLLLLYASCLQLRARDLSVELLTTPTKKDHDTGDINSHLCLSWTVRPAWELGVTSNVAEFGAKVKTLTRKKSKKSHCALMRTRATNAPFARVGLETQRIQKQQGKGMPPPGIEPGTFCLQDRCSTTEPHRRNFHYFVTHFSPPLRFKTPQNTTKHTPHTSRTRPPIIVSTAELKLKRDRTGQDRT
jgi:hypothetical protein